MDPPALTADPALPVDAEPDTAPEVRTARVASAQHLQRLDKVLVALAPEFSRSHLQHLIEAGHVRLDGAAASTS
jgi:23S rRNA pseudouridine1911/1915/1917 synthase